MDFPIWQGNHTFLSLVTGAANLHVLIISLRRKDFS